MSLINRFAGSILMLLLIIGIVLMIIGMVSSVIDENNLNKRRNSFINKECVKKGLEVMEQTPNSWARCFEVKDDMIIKYYHYKEINGEGYLVEGYN